MLFRAYKRSPQKIRLVLQRQFVRSLSCYISFGKEPYFLRAPLQKRRSNLKCIKWQGMVRSLSSAPEFVVKKTHFCRALIQKRPRVTTRGMLTRDCLQKNNGGEIAARHQGRFKWGGNFFWGGSSGSHHGIRTPIFLPPRIWTYLDGARQLRRGAPRRRSPKI